MIGDVVIREFEAIDSEGDHLKIEFFDDLEMSVSINNRLAVVLKPSQAATMLVWCMGTMEKFEKMEKSNASECGSQPKGEK